ncbi:MAG: hypothetical protein RXO32_11405 [Thermoproteus sp.]|jgi:hypothetical protein
MGEEPGVYCIGDNMVTKRYEGHLGGFVCYAELAEAIAKRLEESGRR